MKWKMQVVIPGRVVYVTYAEDASANDVAEALAAVIKEIEKREDASKTFYCISESADGRNSRLSELQSAFRQFRSIPGHTCTILVTKDKIASFLADVVFSMRALRLIRVDTVEEAIAFIEAETDDLKIDSLNSLI
ncbi:MAG: hypothetical protein AAFR81_15855 [Chloroflexota bacterium]